MSDIKIGRIVLGMYQTNCYFLHREDSSEIVVFDPGDSGKYLYDEFTDKGFTVSGIVLTHGHFDHVYGVADLRKLSGAHVYAYKDEEKLLLDPDINVSVSVGRPVTVEADVLLRDGEEFSLAGITFKTIHTPGHTGGSACYYIEDSGILIAGDTLFNLSVGRSDFPTGNGRVLEESVTEKLFVLPDDTKVYPGHGDFTTIGFEKENNPFF